VTTPGQFARSRRATWCTYVPPTHDGARCGREAQRKRLKSGARFSANARRPPALVGVDEELEAVEGEVGEPAEVVGVGVERVLEEAQGGRGVRADPAAPLEGRGKQLVERDDGVDEPPPLGGLGVEEVEQEPDLAAPLLADDAGEVGRAETGVERADPWTALAEARVLGGDGEVAQHVQHVAPADRDAVDGGDDRLRDVADDAVQTLDLEGAPLRLAVRAGLARSLTSPPAQNALSPAPVSTIAATSFEAQPCLKAEMSSSTVRPRNAL
jgi:hypothetical protein